MSLSDTEILKELNKDIIIDPFNFKQLNSNSYDITLGEYYYEPNEEKLPKFLSSENGKQISQYWNVNLEEKNLGSKRAMLIESKLDAKKYGVNVNDRIIILKKGMLILSHTNEIIGAKGKFTTSIQSKSSLGRVGISICKDASLGSTGYINRFTLEIENHSLTDIILVVNQKIAQITFNRCGMVQNDYSKTGQYSLGNTIKEIMKNWSPLNMIPKVAVEYLKDKKKGKKRKFTETK